MNARVKEALQYRTVATFAALIGFDLDAYIDEARDQAREHERGFWKDTDQENETLLRDKKNLQKLAVHHQTRAKALAEKLSKIREVLDAPLDYFGDVPRVDAGMRAAAKEHREQRKATAHPRWKDGEPEGEVHDGELVFLSWQEIAGAVIDLVKHHANLPPIRTLDGYTHEGAVFKQRLEKWAGNGKKEA